MDKKIFQKSAVENYSRQTVYQQSFQHYQQFSTPHDCLNTVFNNMLKYERAFKLFIICINGLEKICECGIMYCMDSVWQIKFVFKKRDAALYLADIGAAAVYHAVDIVDPEATDAHTLPAGIVHGL